MTPLVAPVIDPHLDERTDPTPPSEWQTVVWDDPVNLMSYVVHVFRRYFGFDVATATKVMLNVHERGHAVVAAGPREQMELHAQAMHDYGLWATVRRSE